MNEEEAKKIIDNMSEQELNDFIFFALKEVEKENQKLKTELKKKDKIIYEIAKSNVKLKGYDVEETYINNTISFYTKYIENLERNPHWRKESRKWKLKLEIM